MQKSILIFVIMVFAAYLLSHNLNKPFYGHHDWNGAWYSNFARNILRYPISQTKLGSVMNTGKTSPQHFQYFTHYPPLLPILLALAFFLFGQSEGIARIVPSIFTLFAIFMVFKLGARFISINAGLLAALIYAVFPITIYFGKMPVQEVLVIGPVLLSIYFYFNFFEKNSKSNLIKLLVSLVFSHLINWPGYYVTPLFFLHYLIFSKRHSVKTAVIFPVISFVMFGLHTIYTMSLTGKLLGGGLVDVFLYRLNITSKPIGFTTLSFLNQQSHMLVIYFTTVALLFSAIGVSIIFLHLAKSKITKSDQLLLILGVFGITHNLVFRNMAFIHDYMIIYLTPFIALAVSFVFFGLTGRTKLLNSVKWPLALLLVLSIFFERRDYVKTLIDSHPFYPGYELGLMIKNNSRPTDNILVLSPSFKENNEVFTYYYSDRHVYFQDYSDNLDEEINKNTYNLYVAIPSRDSSVKSIIALQKNMSETIIGDYFLYKPK